MKKTVISIAFLSIAVIFACRKDFSPDVGDSDKDTFLSQSKSYYYQQALKLGGLEVSRNTVGHNNSGADQNAITPLWYKGFISKTSSNEFIEVPIAIGQKRIALYNFNGETNDIKKNLVRINSSFQRLLIYRTKNKNFHQVRLTYIPDYDYLEKNHFDASVNQITKLNSYSGYIEYRSVKGDEIFFLLRFKNGKMVSKKYPKTTGLGIGRASLMTNVKGGGKLSLGGIKDNLIMGGTYKEVCTPIFVTVCAGGGDPYVEECGEPEYIGDECHDEWVESEDPVDPPDPNDDPCSDPANFYICNPENPSNPEIPGEPAAEDPCDRLAKVKANDDNENLNAQNEDIHDHITPGGNEYGADQKLRSLTAGDYKISPVTPGTPDSWQPNFTWNSTDGYSTGHAHSHTDGTAPSPQDVFDLLKNLSKPGLSTASEYEKEFYKQNASLSTETSTGEEYVVTVADWGLLKTIYDDRFLPDPGKFGNEYNLLSDKYKSDHNSSEALATEYGLKGKLGNAINLYKKNPLTGKYEIVKLGQQVGATTGVLSKIGCPD